MSIYQRAGKGGLEMTDHLKNTTLINSKKAYSIPTSEEKTLSLLIYVLNFFTAIIGPLLIWLFKRNKSEYIDHHGKEYFNLIISFFVYESIAAMTIFIGIGIVLVPFISIVFLIFIILGAYKSYQGEYYRFPFIFRLIK